MILTPSHIPQAGRVPQPDPPALDWERVGRTSYAYDAEGRYLGCVTGTTNGMRGLEKAFERAMA